MLLLLKEVGNAKPGVRAGHHISVKTPAKQNKPMERKKKQ